MPKSFPYSDDLQQPRALRVSVIERVGGLENGDETAKKGLEVKKSSVSQASMPEKRMAEK